jgi:hypothetical protein
VSSVLCAEKRRSQQLKPPYQSNRFQWFFWGYSLTFGAGGSKFIGTLENFGLMGVLEAESAGSTKLPAIVYAIYQVTTSNFPTSYHD